MKATLFALRLNELLGYAFNKMIQASLSLFSGVANIIDAYHKLRLALRCQDKTIKVLVPEYSVLSNSSYSSQPIVPQVGLEL